MHSKKGDRNPGHDDDNLHLDQNHKPLFHIHTPGDNKQLEMWLAGFAAAKVTDLLEISSLQGLVPHLTEVHVTIVVTLFPLKRAHKTHTLTRSLANTEQ